MQKKLLSEVKYAAEHPTSSWFQGCAVVRSSAKMKDILIRTNAFVVNAPEDTEGYYVRLSKRAVSISN